MTALNLRDAVIEAAYARIPGGFCKGLCQESCGPLLYSPAEGARMVERIGEEPDFDPDTLRCTWLKAGKCSHYEDRPAVCRIYGTIRDFRHNGMMRCPHGCVPPGGFASDESMGDVIELLEGVRP